MTRHYFRKPPLTLVELCDDGPLVKLRDLAAISGISKEKIRADARAGIFQTVRLSDQPNANYYVQRHEARRYLARFGFHGEHIAKSA